MKYHYMIDYFHIREFPNIFALLIHFNLIEFHVSLDFGGVVAVPIMAGKYWLQLMVLCFNQCYLFPMNITSDNISQHFIKYPEINLIRISHCTRRPLSTFVAIIHTVKYLIETHRKFPIIRICSE